MSDSVCVVEDDLLVRAEICGVLRDEGFDVVEADNADQATVLIERHRCAAALVDILMPGRDGLDLIRELRSVHPGMKLIAMSGGGRVSAQVYLRFAAEVGADATLIKPVEPALLLQALRSAQVRLLADVRLSA